MIVDPDALSEIKQSWIGVERLREKIQRALLGSFAEGAVSAVFLIADAAHNLPFIQACAVLNDVLRQLADEGQFQAEPRARTLGALLKASKSRLKWQNFSLIEEATKDRNAIAHDGEIIDRGDCWKYIDAIRTELVSWQVIDTR